MSAGNGALEVLPTSRKTEKINDMIVSDTENMRQVHLIKFPQFTMS